MDIAKYIGLFLLKNNFVYIHGLGNLELKKKSSRHNGEALTAPTYEIVMTQLGSIDDNLANFIATNEQISISKASNSLREFSIQARADMHTGKAVEIPGIGKFVEERGKTVFVTDPTFTHTPPPLPTMKFAKRAEEPYHTASTATPNILSDAGGAPEPNYPTPAYDPTASSGTINWGKIALWIGALIAAAALAFFGIKYMNEHKATQDLPLIISKDTAKQVEAPVTADTATSVPAESTPAVAENNGLLKFNVLLNTYDVMDKAIRRAEKLKSYGNNVEMRAAADSSAFYVVMPVSNVAAADTSRFLDSLRRNFNPNGVSILSE